MQEIGDKGTLRSCCCSKVKPQVKDSNLAPGEKNIPLAKPELKTRTEKPASEQQNSNLLLKRCSTDRLEDNRPAAFPHLKPSHLVLPQIGG